MASKTRAPSSRGSPAASAPQKKKSKAADRAAAPEPEEGATAAGSSSPPTLHPLLARLVGTWEATNTMFQDGKPGMAGQGKAVVERALGGRVVRMTYAQDIPGLGAFEGEALFGYSEADETFQGTWVDSASSSVFCYRGGAGEGGKSIQLDSYAPFTDERTKTKKTTQSTYTFKSENEVHFEMFNKAGRAAPVKAMDIVYRRARASD